MITDFPAKSLRANGYAANTVTATPIKVPSVAYRMEFPYPIQMEESLKIRS
ncbi:hypothetical protein D3C85_1708770 [compost metagenome]